MESKPPTAAQQLVVFWVLWAAFLGGVCVQYFFLQNKKPPAGDETSAWIAAVLPVVVSIIIRWNVLPRAQTAPQALPLMIIGIALAESTVFLGIFLFPAHQWVLFLAAFFGIAQHAPVYAQPWGSPPPNS